MRWAAAPKLRYRYVRDKCVSDGADAPKLGYKYVVLDNTRMSRAEVWEHVSVI